MAKAWKGGRGRGGPFRLREILGRFEEGSRKVLQRLLGMLGMQKCSEEVRERVWGKLRGKVPGRYWEGSWEGFLEGSSTHPQQAF